MARSDRTNQPAGNAPEVANLGIVRPPLVYLASIVAGLALQFFWPLRLLPPRLSLPLGAIAIVVAVALFVVAARSFRAAGTPVTEPAHHDHRPHRALPLQPESHLPGVLPAPARDRPLGQQRLAAAHADPGGAAHVTGGDSQGRGVPGGALPGGVPALQEVRAAMVVGSMPLSV